MEDILRRHTSLNLIISRPHRNGNLLSNFMPREEKGKTRGRTCFFPWKEILHILTTFETTIEDENEA